MKIVRPSELGTSGLARVMVYGDNGNGKTHLLSTIPQSMPTLVLSVIGENLDPLRGPQEEWIRASEPLERWDQIHKEVYPFLASGKHPFKAVAFDTWTAFHALASAQVTGLPVRTALDRMSKAVVSKTNWDQLRGISELCVNTMREFMQLPYHLIFLAQEETKESKLEEGDIRTQPRLIAGPWALDGTKEVLKTIAYLYVVPATGGDGSLSLDAPGSSPSARSVNPNRTDQRMLLIGKHDRYFTKGDSAKLGYVIEDPTWTKLAKAWE